MNVHICVFRYITMLCNHILYLVPGYFFTPHKNPSLTHRPFPSPSSKLSPTNPLPSPLLTVASLGPEFLHNLSSWHRVGHIFGEFILLSQWENSGSGRLNDLPKFSQVESQGTGERIQDKCSHNGHMSAVWLTYVWLVPSYLTPQTQCSIPSFFTQFGKSCCWRWLWSCQPPRYGQ